MTGTCFWDHLTPVDSVEDPCPADFGPCALFALFCTAVSPLQMSGICKDELVAAKMRNFMKSELSRLFTSASMSGPRVLVPPSLDFVNRNNQIRRDYHNALSHCAFFTIDRFFEYVSPQLSATQHSHTDILAIHDNAKGERL